MILGVVFYNLNANDYRGISNDFMIQVYTIFIIGAIMI